MPAQHARGTRKPPSMPRRALNACARARTSLRRGTVKSLLLWVPDFVRPRCVQTGLARVGPDWNQHWRWRAGDWFDAYDGRTGRRTAFARDRNASRPLAGAAPCRADGARNAPRGCAPSCDPHRRAACVSGPIAVLGSPSAPAERPAPPPRVSCAESSFRPGGCADRLAWRPRLPRVRTWLLPPHPSCLGAAPALRLSRSLLHRTWRVDQEEKPQADSYSPLRAPGPAPSQRSPARHVLQMSWSLRTLRGRLGGKGGHRSVVLLPRTGHPDSRLYPRPLFALAERAIAPRHRSSSSTCSLTQIDGSELAW